MKKILSFIVILTMSVTMLMAQIQVTGTVISAEDNEPVIGASILVKGTQTGTTTDIDGNFSLKVPEKAKTLVISYIGMRTQEVAVKPKLSITLESDMQIVEEVVVTGMGQVDKRLFTGATVKVDADKAKLSGASDVSRSLEGRVAGVQVTNVSGTFGAAPKIRVRGATSIYGNSKPLWVVDGVIYEDNVDVTADELSSGDAKTLISSAVAGLNSDDIESFQILKDGSATSIYGARAMAGVVVVTTKRGQKGHASVNYTGEFTYRMKPNYRDYNIMNSQETMGIYRELDDKGWLNIETLSNAQRSGIYGKMFQLLRQYDPQTNSFALQNTLAAKNAYLQEAEFRNTDWFDLLFTNAIMQNHSVSVSAGTEKSQSRFSISLMNDPGQYVNRSKVNRYTFNGNTSYEVIKGLTVKLAGSGSYREQEAPGSNQQAVDPVSGELNRNFENNPYTYALRYSRAMNPHEKYTSFFTDYNIFDELNLNYEDLKSYELMFRGEVEYKPIRAVTLTGLVATRLTNSRSIHNVMDDSNQANAYRAGVDANDDNSTIAQSNSLLYTDPDNDLAQPVSILPYGGIKYQSDHIMRSNTLKFMAEYRNVFKELHTVNAMVGTEAQMLRRTGPSDNAIASWIGWGYRYNYGGVTYTPYLWLKQMNEENTEYFGESFKQTNTIAFYGTATYSYAQRYTLTGVLRYEGTNRLGNTPGANRWMPTWNISGKYDIWSEPWMESTHDWLSGLALRGSFSLTADTGPYWVTNFTNIYHTTNLWRPNVTDKEMGIDLSQVANNELTFEKKHEWNLGVDMSFLDDRLALNVDVYTRDNFDLIGMAYTQGCGGQIAKWANIADMNSKGIEFGLSTVNIKNQKFSWSSDLIYSYSKNEITSLKTASRAIDLVSGRPDMQSGSGFGMEGYPVRPIFSYKFAGLTDEGLPMVYDEEGNINMGGDINLQNTEHLTDYLKYEGPADPVWNGSFSNNFSYDFGKAGKLNLDVFITYSGGNVVRLDQAFHASYDDMSSFPKEFNNRWMMPGDEKKTDIPVIPSREQVNHYGGFALQTAYNTYNYSDVRLAKGDFVRLKEVALSWTAPKALVAKTGFLSTASCKLAATNLCLLYADSKLNGQDPECVNAGGVSSPMTKQFTFTLRLGF